MHGKKTESKFTIQFSRSDPAHLRVADILNKQERHGKARYIVEAVMHYLSCDDARHAAQIDDKRIEAVVSRILRGWSESGTGVLPVSVPAGQADDPSLLTSTISSEIIYDDALKTLGEDGYNAITSALDTFRKK